MISGNEILNCSASGVSFGVGDKRAFRISDNNISAREVNFDGEQVFDIVIDGNVISSNNGTPTFLCTKQHTPRAEAVVDHSALVVTGAGGQHLALHAHPTAQEAPDCMAD